MPYKPKFCCQCGEKIERVSWNPLTSRRFCELCETEFGINDKLPLFLVGVVLLFGLVGWGNYLRTPEKLPNAAPNSFISSSQNVNKTEVIRANSAIQAQTNNSPKNTSKETAPTTNLTIKKPETASNSSQEEVSYFCGAATKKGTPCSRRVKGSGRCWQHEGQTAIVPPEKLIVRQ